MIRKAAIALSLTLCACVKSFDYVANPPFVEIDPLAEDAQNLQDFRDAPILVKFASAVYPRKSFNERRQGYVIVEYDVLPDGTVVNPRVLEEKPRKNFASSALIEVQKYKYEKSPHGYRNMRTEIDYSIHH